MKVFLFILSVFVSGFCYSQIDTIVFGHIDKLPMVNSIAYSYDYSHSYTCHSDPVPYLYIQSFDSSVFSAIDGTVSAVFDIGDKQAIILKTYDDKLIIYTNLNKAFVLRGQKVFKGIKIGIASNDYDNKNFELSILLETCKGNYLNEKNIWKLIDQANYIPIAAVCDATVMP